MTDFRTPPAPALRSARLLSSRDLLRNILGGLAALGLVLATVGPARLGLNFRSIDLSRVHAPDLDRIAQAPATVQLHLAAVLIALAVGGVLLIGVKGSRLHRALGWAWVLAMMAGAVSSLFIRQINHGKLSGIHLISGWVIVALPLAVAFARRHKVKAHARTMTGLFTGGLIIAGLFACTPGRLIWSLFFG